MAWAMLILHPDVGKALGYSGNMASPNELTGGYNTRASVTVPHNTPPIPYIAIADQAGELLPHATEWSHSITHWGYSGGVEEVVVPAQVGRMGAQPRAQRGVATAISPPDNYNAPPSGVFNSGY
jgi:hypothetical protein